MIHRLVYVSIIRHDPSKLVTVMENHSRKWWILFAVSMSLGLTFIDQAAVGIALPKIQQVFNLSPVLLAWIVNAYLLTLAVFMIFGGYLGDFFQHHNAFITGLVIFFIASILCALAPNISWLIGSRIIQGFGAALLLPNASVLVLNAFPPHEKGKAMGIYMGSSLLFLPLALLIGGVFTQYYSWRLIFWINIPLCIASLYIINIVLTSFPIINSKKNFDWLGFIILTCSIFFLVFGLMEAGTLGFDSLIIKLLILGALGGAIIFYKVEQQQFAPLIDFRLFQNKIILAALLLLFCLSFSTGIFIFDALFFQQVLGYRPAFAGLLFFPNIICIIICAPLAGRILDAKGYRLPVILGLVLVTFGLIWKAVFAFSQNYWYLLLGSIAANSGVPFVLTPINTQALASVEMHQRGIISGILNATRHITGSVSLALLTALISGSNQYFLKIFIVNNQANYPALTTTIFDKLLAKSLTSKQFTTDQLTILYHTVKSTYTTAYAIGQFTAGIFALLGLSCILWIFKKKRRV